MRVRRGTQAIKGTKKVLVKTTGPGGMRRLRCPQCQKVTTPTLNVHNKYVYKCGCGRTWQSTVM